LEHFKIQLFSTNQFGEILDIEYTKGQSEIIFDLLYIFNTKFDNVKQKVNTDKICQNTEEFQIKLENYILKHKDDSPQIEQLGAKFKKLKENEWFFILPPVEFDAEEKHKLEEELNILNDYN
jgi:hypothetical protein